ncbi:MAG TPA: alpha-glucan phosphorylase, partial [Planctomycetota bacterium]|nr:alpha-glucan phosphorylase [Planctomycetota bacterium]
RALVQLGSLQPGDVAVDIASGPLDTEGRMQEAVSSRMAPEGQNGAAHKFTAKVMCRASGRHGFAVRVLPNHPALIHPYDEGLIQWA